MTYETICANIEDGQGYTLSSHARSFRISEGGYASDSTALYQSARKRYNETSQIAKNASTTGDYSQIKSIQEVAGFFARNMKPITSQTSIN